ncbi:CD48 antigen-like [Pelobates cultripes]|uniref:CD48 antigen-like n=1 Tax=Pelobates cultripes TaxID=61616 RepID=A0AAD1TGP1_PELCU|nr:CD48 antigen-like [Pelobates cultripes]CAH2326857.1 CD48 antigen-like [Pelobates cultripes]
MLHPAAWIPCMLLAAFLLGSAQHDVPLPVSGLLYQSVYLSRDVSLTHPVEDASWTFQTNGEEIRIAKFSNSQFKVYNNNPLNNRIKPSNNMTGLTIRDLRIEDSGIYTARIMLTNSMIYRASFNLTVYDLYYYLIIKLSLVCISVLLTVLARITWRNGRKAFNIGQTTRANKETDHILRTARY